MRQCSPQEKVILSLWFLQMAQKDRYWLTFVPIFFSFAKGAICIYIRSAVCPVYLLMCLALYLCCRWQLLRPICLYSRLRMESWCRSSSSGRWYPLAHIQLLCWLPRMAHTLLCRYIITKGIWC